MRRHIVFFVGLFVLIAAVADAAEWHAIRPGESTQDDVRAQLGQPTRVASQKVDGYDSAQWLYEGPQAPGGILKVTLDFGILTPQGYKAHVVRVMQLVPKPGIFSRQNILTGWGEPEGVKTEAGVPSIMYQSGLIVTFDKEGQVATTLTFTPPQQVPQTGSSPRR
jgi:hypothetical protein